MKIKIGIRHNLIYPILLSTFTLFRKVDTILMSEINDFKGSLLLTLIMFFSEIISGLVLYISQIIFILNSEESISKEINAKRNTLKSINSSILNNKNSFGMYMMLLAISFFDFIEFILSTYYLPYCFPKYKIKSNSLEVRLGNIATIFSAFFYHFVLKFNLFKHQKLSLLIIFICLLTIVISEIFFETILENSDPKGFYYVLLLITINYFFLSSIVNTEKYLLEYHKINPYKMLMIEGIFGLIITSMYALYENPFKEIKYNYNHKNKEFFLLFIFLLLYFLFSGGRNIYRILTNKIYSPMTKIMADSFLDPLLIIYCFSFKGDLQNTYFFIINLSLSIIMVFFGLVFNDFLILYCCNLEYETYLEISKRADTIEDIKPLQNNEMTEIINDDYYTSCKKNEIVIY